MTTAPWEESTSCSAGAVRYGKPTTTPNATTASERHWAPRPRRAQRPEHEHRQDGGHGGPSERDEERVQVDDGQLRRREREREGDHPDKRQREALELRCGGRVRYPRRLDNVTRGSHGLE